MTYRRRVRGLLFALGLSSLFALRAFSAPQDICLDCHSDPDLKAERLTGNISLCVTEDSLKGSPHEGFACTDCHADLAATEDFPHGPVRHVDCGTCHEDAMKAFMEGFFKKLNEMGYRGIPACSDCHGMHQMSKRADTRRVCGICHRAELKALEASIHGPEGAGAEQLVCTSCHEPHFKSRRSTMSALDWEMMLVKGCMRCHKSETHDYQESKHYATIAAGDTSAPVCITCHDYHAVLSPQNPAAATSTERLDNLCATCHRGYDQTLHRKDEADPRLMTCVACHTGHRTQMDRTTEGAVFRETLPATCNRCHGDERHKKEMYAHGDIMLLDESGGEANCTECHVYHWRKGGATHEASLRMQCQNCHVKETQEYMRSAHAISREKGHLEPPTCTTCHGERDIKKVADAMTPQQVIDLCSKCHGNREIALRFQINSEVVKSYKRTYHGQAYALGYQGADFATCINCHGNHDIRSADDPESMISRQNIVKTCARCHEDANENFVSFLSHYDPHGGEAGALSPERKVSTVESFMNTLLLAVFGFFGIHTLLWFVRSKAYHTRNPRTRSPETQRKWIRRFTPWQRTLHIMLFSTFLLQAATGLPLKFSHSVISYWIASHILGLHTMALIHRISAGVMIGTFVLHVLTLLWLWIVQRKKGMWSGPHSLMPRWQDVKDMVGHFRWFFWLGERPKFGRWTYWEKFDYFAVFWGVVVIGSTGFVLWFPEFFTRNLPGWIINLAHIVHSDEALLATGFIFTVHFFNGHLRPGKFPFDDVIFTGRESTEEMAHERPNELELLTAEGTLEAHYVPPMRSWSKQILKLYGWIGFIIGITLLIFIIKSMIF
ncbi:MAG: cytochrome c3 family protein [Calditrichota bacterium]